MKKENHTLVTIRMKGQGATRKITIDTSKPGHEKMLGKFLKQGK